MQFTQVVAIALAAAASVSAAPRAEKRGVSPPFIN